MWYLRRSKLSMKTFGCFVNALFVLSSFCQFYLCICVVGALLGVRQDLFNIVRNNTPQGTNYTVSYFPSRKLYKLDEPHRQDTAGEAKTSS